MFHIKKLFWRVNYSINEKSKQTYHITNRQMLVITRQRAKPTPNMIVRRCQIPIDTNKEVIKIIFK